MSRRKRILRTLVLGICSFALFGCATVKSEAERYRDQERGIDSVVPIYADSQTFIFDSGIALFVYDLEKEKLTAALNYKENGIMYTQGDEAYSIVASKDGTNVYFVNQIKGNKIYRLSDDSFSEYEEDVDNSMIFTDVFELIENETKYIQTEDNEQIEGGVYILNDDVVYYITITLDSANTHSGIVLNVAKPDGEVKKYHPF